jgi:hypothetical protein
LSDHTREPDPIPEPTVSRRRFLAAGAVPLVPLVLPHEAAAGAPPPTVYDVTTYGAQGDGTSDDRAPIQAAIDAASARGGGTVVFPAGTFRVGGALTIRSQIVFRGAGVRTTVIRKTAEGNYPLLQSSGFPNGAPIHSFSLQNLSLDGNRDAGAQGHGIQVTAYAYSLFNVTIYGCAGRGLWSEYFETLPADGHSMEAMLVNVTVLHCTQGGIYWNGPHDSQWTNVVVSRCGPAGIENGSTTKGVEVARFGPGLRATNCHVWGLNQAYGWWLEGEAPGLVNCTAEGAEIAQVVVIGHDAQIVGGKYFGSRAELEAAAFQIGELGLPAPAGTFINSKVVNCLGALNFVRDAGIGRYAISVWQTDGDAVRDRDGLTMRPSNRLDIQVSGGAKPGRLAGLRQVTFQESMLSRRDLDVRGDVQAGGSGARVGFLGATPQPQTPGWSASGGDRRTLPADADLASVREVLGTLVRELKRFGLLGG